MAPWRSPWLAAWVVVLTELTAMNFLESFMTPPALEVIDHISGSGAPYLGSFASHILDRAGFCSGREAAPPFIRIMNHRMFMTQQSYENDGMPYFCVASDIPPQDGNGYHF